ncbi:MAG: hypothetical protein V1702_00675 [Candidatus Woesearchaeota archaeon]
MGKEGVIYRIILMKQEEEVKKGFAKITPGLTCLLRLSEGDSLLTGLYALQHFVSGQKNEGIYIACNTNSPVDFLGNYFEAHAIDTDMLHFIDSVSIPLLERKRVQKENFVYLEENHPSQLLLALDNAVEKRPKANFVYLDSLTELLKYHDAELVLAFLEKLVGRIRDFRMSGLVLAYYGEREQQIITEALSHCDFHMEI